ncbi:DUF2637 domain-containing protein [Streptomyces sp. NPDC001633]|uniref:DUF2637 domain-containing protein n=1 Tax=Streptomyces sp. NPDC001633 TaxID=3364595 RepID=UPI0036C818EE
MSTTTLEAPEASPVDEPESPPDSPTPAEEHDQEQPEEKTGAALRRIMAVVAVIALLGGLTVAAIGFALSYRSLESAAVGWGFGQRGAAAFPIGIDGAVVAFVAIDLLLVWRRMARPLLRYAAHTMTAVTIALNISAAIAGNNAWQALTTDPGRILGHAVMPILFVLCVEAARHAVVRTAELEDGTGGIPPHRWLMDPLGTWQIFRTMKLWDVTYTQVREQRRTLAIHRVWQDHREDIDAGRLDALPDLLAPHGVTVAEALALPAKMRRAEQERQQAAAREDRKLKADAAAEERAVQQAERLAELAAEAEALRAEGELDVLRATVDGEREVARRRAEAAAATAGIEASAARTAAERRATEEERKAEAEAQAEETARTAAARRKAAQDHKAALETEAGNLQQREKNAAAAERAAAAEAKAKWDAKVAAEAEEEAEAAKRRTLEHRAAVAHFELTAAAAEDGAGLTERERNVRRVARLVLVEAQGDTLRLPLARIEQVLGVSNGTASGYRTEAAHLLNSGYDPRKDPLHQLAAAH